MTKQPRSDMIRVTAMAFDRQGYKSRLEEHLRGAVVEFYKARLAMKNHQARWVTHWNSESDRLVNQQFGAAIGNTIRGFKDRQKAIAEVIRMLKAQDGLFRVRATNEVLRDFNLRKLKFALDETDRSDFWSQVEARAALELENLKAANNN